MAKKKKREIKPTIEKVEVIEMDSTIEEIKSDLENGVTNLRFLSNKYNKTINEIINIKTK